MEPDKEPDMEPKQRTKSVHSDKSVKSKTSTRSSINSIILQKQAEAESSRVKAQYAQKEAEILQRKAAIEAELDILQHTKNVAATEAELKILQSGEFITDLDQPPISIPVENPEDRTQRYVINHMETLDHTVVPETNNIIVSDSLDSLNPQAAPFIPNQAIQNIFSGNQEQNYNSNDFTKFLLKRDLLFSRLTNFNDQPDHFHSWKSGFLSIMHDLDVNAGEELDLLVKWLGAESSHYAANIRAANPNNPARGLQRTWERLNDRYGSPEMLESTLRNKVENFPKLTNKDNKKLFDLCDLLSEIESLKENEQFSSLLSYYDSSIGVNPIVAKLPYGFQEKWTAHAIKYKASKNCTFPPFSYFVQFIRDLSRNRNDPSFVYESTTTTSQTKKWNQIRTVNTTVKATKTEPEKTEKANIKCPLHNSNHKLEECRAFKAKHIDERKEILRDSGICFRCCASTKHMSRDCQETVKCLDCKSDKHPTALHIRNFRTVWPPPPTDYGGETKKDSPVTTKCTQICGSNFAGKSCSKTLLVNVFPKNQPDQAKRMYVIIDDQSNSSLAKSDFFDLFDINSELYPYILTSCSGKVNITGRRTCDFVVQSLDNSVSVDLPVIVECNSIPNQREEIPTPNVAEHYTHLSDLVSNIPPIDPSADILLLIGRDVPEAHHVLEQRFGHKTAPFAQRLRLGWVIIGETCLGKIHQTDTINVNKTFVLANGRPTVLTPCMNNFTVKSTYTDNHNQSFDSDKPFGNSVFIKSPDDEKVGMSVEDRQFISLMDTSFTKGTEGNWVAPLPFKTERRRLPNNKSQAIKRAKTLHNSLSGNMVKKQHFFDFMHNIFENKHAELAPPPSPNNECWYLPLFGVYHPKKPDKIRGVFDSSATFDGVCLNDVLLKGPDLTNSLLGVLLRFRKDKIAVIADIECMFYNFYVQEDHRDYLKFIWYKDNDFDKELADYRMKVHVFGNSPSPAVATYGLRKTAEIGQSKYGQDVVDFVCRNFYVDDGLISLPTTQAAIDLMTRTQECLATCGNIRLHKFVSNSQEFMNAFPSSDRAKDLRNMDLGSDSVPLQRSLGLLWDVNTDCFTFQVSSKSKPFTRRGVLSVINSLYDPLGQVAPVVAQGKLLLREFMAESVDWDDPLPPHREKEWDNWKQSLLCLEELNIPRPYTNLENPVCREIIVYSDASEMCIAAVAYMRTVDKEGNENISFVLGKSKLAPTSGHTIPRLELCAAVLAGEIGEIVAEQLDFDLTKIKYFTDSRIVLGYLNNTTRRFYMYVSNRVERIRKSSSPCQWGFVSTKNNPADTATRSFHASNMATSAWLSGPTHLPKISLDDYPLYSPETDKEVRPHVTCKDTHLDSVPLSIRFEKFSSWKKLVTAITVLKHIARNFSSDTDSQCHGWHHCQQSRDLTLNQETEHWIFKQVQTEFYSTEIDCIRNSKVLPNNSPIRALSPILDNNGLLRVGGRLNKSNFSPEGKNPLLLPGKHHISKLLIRHYHEEIRHQGRHFTEGAIRAAGFWITGCKRLVSSLCHQCVKCRKLRATTSVQKMADLPPDRLSPAPPFTFVGVDTFGHWNIVSRRTRGGMASSKRWAILFTCLVTRAVHIEVVAELSSSAFINALRRFISIRGSVKLFRSDKGTNFIGATDDLKIDAINVDDKVSNFLHSNGAKWIFNPPHSSHMGGSWERMIGVARRILDSMLTEVATKNLTHDVLVTFMAEVCAIINSRPLLPVSTDPESPFILTPNTLLTQKTDNFVEPLSSSLDRDPRDIYKAEWKRVQLLADIFWKRWKQEYVQTLQVRRKWQDSLPNIKENDFILLKEKNCPRNEWPVGIIEECIPGSDEKVRKAIVRVFKGDKCVCYTRPITEMVLLLSSD